jgi:hypothetical protein
MAMCKRTTTDPLLSLVSGDGFTLLQSMRTGVKPLATWVDFTGHGPFEPVGQLTELIEGGLAELPCTCADRADIENQQTHVFEAGVGLAFLAPFFAVIGLAALTKLRARIEGMRRAYVRIRASQVTEVSISLAALTQELDSTQIAASQGRLLTDDRRVAFASHVLRAQSISIEAVRQSGRGLNLGAKVVLAADLDGDARFHRESKSEISFTGTVPVTFGVRLYELQIDSDRRAFRLDHAPGYPVLGRPGATADKGPTPLLLGGHDGDLVADL